MHITNNEWFHFFPYFPFDEWLWANRFSASVQLELRGVHDWGGLISVMDIVENGLLGLDWAFHADWTWSKALGKTF